MLLSCPGDTYSELLFLAILDFIKAVALYVYIKYLESILLSRSSISARIVLPDISREFKTACSRS